jgi:hypothetical protein
MAVLDTVSGKNVPQHLTRAAMQAVLREGGSIFYTAQTADGKTQTVHILREDQLPSEADLVQGNAAAAQAVVDSYDAQIAELQAQRARAAAAAQAVAVPDAESNKRAAKADKADADDKGDKK